MFHSTIICLIGESGSGKTTIAREMHLNGFPVISSYTTRPPRQVDEWGHIFTTKDKILEDYGLSPTHSNKDEVIEKLLSIDCNVVAYTLYKDNFYWITKDQYQGYGAVFYVVDQQGYETLLKNVDDADIISVYLSASRESRMCRVSDRNIRDSLKSGGDCHEINNSIDNGVREALSRVNHDDDHFYDMEYDYIVDTNCSLAYSMVQMDRILLDLVKKHA